MQFVTIPIEVMAMPQQVAMVMTDVALFFSVFDVETLSHENLTVFHAKGGAHFRRPLLRIGLTAFSAFCRYISHFLSVFSSMFKSNGLAMCSFIPTVLAACTSSAKALAVMAMIGTCLQ